MARAVVLALLTDGFGTSGGIGQYNRDLMTALAQSSAVSHVIALPRNGLPEEPPPGRVTQLSPADARSTFAARAMALALDQRFDVIFCGHLNIAPLAAALAMATGAKLWLQVHGIDAWDRPNSVVRSAVARAELVTAVSRYTRSRLLGWSNIAPDRVRVLPNTVAVDYVQRVRRPELVSRYGLAGRKVILTVGRIAKSESYKGHDRIVAALKAVAAHFTNVVYLVVGTGDDEPRLKAEAARLGVQERIIFTGEVRRSELPDHFALADVFAMPSTGEGFGIVFLEAARSGLPVIGGNRDGSMDALADGIIGLPIDPYDHSQLVDALLAALNGHLNANAVAVERFSFERYAIHVHSLVKLVFHA